MKIKNKKDYHNTMVAIYKLMDRSGRGISDAEQKRLTAMVTAVEKFEDEILDVHPKGIPDPIKDI